MVEVAPDDDPPHGDVATEPVVRNKSTEVIFAETRKYLAASLSKNCEPVEESLELRAIGDRGDPGPRLDAGELRIRQLGKEPFVGVGQMLSDVGEAKTVLKRPPVLASRGDEPESLERRLADRF